MVRLLLGGFAGIGLSAFWRRLERQWCNVGHGFSWCRPYSLRRQFAYAGISAKPMVMPWALRHLQPLLITECPCRC